MSIALRQAGYKNTQSIQQTCKPDQEFGKFHQRALMHDPMKTN